MTTAYFCISAFEHCTAPEEYFKAMQMRFFMRLGLNEADTLKSSWIPIYSHPMQGIYTRREWHDAMLIKETKLKVGSN